MRGSSDQQMHQRPRLQVSRPFLSQAAGGHQRPGLSGRSSQARFHGGCARRTAHAKCCITLAAHQAIIRSLGGRRRETTSAQVWLTVSSIGSRLALSGSYCPGIVLAHSAGRGTSHAGGYFQACLPYAAGLGALVTGLPYRHFTASINSGCFPPRWTRWWWHASPARFI